MTRHRHPAEHVPTGTEPRDGDLLVFYGSLLRGLGLVGEPVREPGLRFAGPCLLAGELYVVGEGHYPALRRPEDGAAPGATVKGEAWQVRDLRTLAAFDAWELAGHAPGSPGAPYERVRARLLDRDAHAWTYAGRHPEQGEVVPGGDWRAWRSRRRRTTAERSSSGIGETRSRG